MHELSRYLFVAGAVPFVLLGLAHAIATPLEVGQARGLSPRDAGLAKAMSQAPILLTSRTNMWLAWVGFNLSHSLGILFFGIAVLLIGRSTSSFTAEGRLFGPLAVVVSTGYLFLAIKYWFRTPIVGCAVSVVLFVSSWLLAGAEVFAAGDSGTVRARALELVDDRGRVRAQLNVESDGETVFRLRDSKGEIRVKLGAGGDGSGLLLLDGSTEPGIHMLAKSSGTTVTLTNSGGQRRVITP
jgi:hypothetical protein